MVVNQASNSCLLAKFESMKRKLDSCDVWHIRKPDSRGFTYPSESPFLQRRLDYFFISDSIQEDVSQIDILASINAIILQCI